jgi:2-beta-glucuronyltransferase
MDKILIISGHDYRSRRRADTHFIANAIKQEASVRFFSIGFSSLSRFKADPRTDLASEANRIVDKDGVSCYLWKTLVHPFRMRSRVLRPVEYLHFNLYRHAYPLVLREWIAEADVLVFDSGMSPVLMPLAKEANPRATLIYNAADDLPTIGCSSYVSGCLASAMEYIDWIRVPSRILGKMLPPGGRVFYIPHGIDPSIADAADPSPYGEGLHAVSIGSMLFDASFFQTAALAFPEVTFHVIGAGAAGRQLSGPNIRVYGEMPFQETLRFVKHADLGVAPYRSDRVPEYLADTSMKLGQYSFFGIPAVCPTFAAGEHPHRSGYIPGDAASVAGAISSALAAGRVESRKYLNWREVAERLLRPEDFLDTAL